MKTKNYFKSTLLLLAFSLLSCTNDSKPAQTYADLLPGKWEFDKQITNGVEQDQANPGGCSRNFLEYKNNVRTEGHYNPNDCKLDLYTDNYTLEGDVIKVTYSSGGTFESKILQLTTTSLKVSTYDGKYINTFKRIK